jgi:sentrin-specific protease 1
VVKYARETVKHKDLMCLKPGKWLNDEIINFYGALILGRSEGFKENRPHGVVVGEAVKGRRTPLNVHYFSTFFWTKLVNEGYDKGRLAKWTKKVGYWISPIPSSLQVLIFTLQIEIFSKDAILIPVNHNNTHWAAAAINFRQKRIESFDSMGIAKKIVFSVRLGCVSIGLL